MPTLRAVCKLLYTLCKIRGSKVITRFFENEPKYLEPILKALEHWTRALAESPNPSESPAGAFESWETRYVTILWLAHLMLTPFSLESIDTGFITQEQDGTLGLSLPSGLPHLSCRLISVGLAYVSSASKEREAANAMLVRLVLRPDMQSLGLHESLVRWALSSLDGPQSSTASSPTYQSIGALSFLAQTVKTANAEAIAPFLLLIFKRVQSIASGNHPCGKIVMVSAVSRKAVIKVYCAICVVALRMTAIPAEAKVEIIDYVLEDAMDHFLTSLADNDTPVRYAASKAISVVSEKLDPSMATDVSDAIIGGLEENMLWEEGFLEFDIENTMLGVRAKSKLHSFGAVNALKWHGLILALSHLLFRRSPPNSQLPSVLNALILALGFEQRSSSGHSVGANVRDAACFGIWALARKYTTKELLDVPLSSVRVAKSKRGMGSILQILAIELVVASTADPSGNIRRGASASLQELVGRHPDTIPEGIDLVQTIDYQAVALRSKAIGQIAADTAKLSGYYWQALMAGSLTWRALDATDAQSRRLAAESFGPLASVEGISGVKKGAEFLCAALANSFDASNKERRHGFMLGAVAIMRQFQEKNRETDDPDISSAVFRFWELLAPEVLITEKDLTFTTLRPEITAEALCLFMAALASVTSTQAIKKQLPRPEILENSLHLLDLSLARHEEIVIRCASKAAKSLFCLVSEDIQRSLLGRWLSITSTRRSSSVGHGHLAALGSIYPTLAGHSQERDRILDILLGTISPSVEIETRIVAVQSLNRGILPCGGKQERIDNLERTNPYHGTLGTSRYMVRALKLCLEDYTTDQRGDIGSLLRLEAIAAVHTIGQIGSLQDPSQFVDLAAALCTLAAEKLDKVRFKAYECLLASWTSFMPFASIAHGRTIPLTLL